MKHCGVQREIVNDGQPALLIDIKSREVVPERSLR
jgi:hypothetical protein